MRLSRRSNRRGNCVYCAPHVKFRGRSEKAVREDPGRRSAARRRDSRRCAGEQAKRRVHSRGRPRLRRRRLVVAGDAQARRGANLHAQPRPPRGRGDGALLALLRRAGLRAVARVDPDWAASAPRRLLGARQHVRPSDNRAGDAGHRNEARRIPHDGDRQVGRRRGRRVGQARHGASARQGVRRVLRLHGPSRRPHVLPLRRHPARSVHGHLGEPREGHGNGGRAVLDGPLLRPSQERDRFRRQGASRQAVLPLPRRQHGAWLRPQRRHPEGEASAPRAGAAISGGGSLVAARPRAARRAQHMDRPALPQSAKREHAPVRDGSVPPGRRGRRPRAAP